MKKGNRISNVNIVSKNLLPAPARVLKDFPLSSAQKQSMVVFRQKVRDILDRKDRRLLAIVGPCSIHNMDAALEYAHLLKGLSDRIHDEFYVIMRIYFEKPRTSVGWKGFINDPFMDDTFRIDYGLRRAREFLRDVCAIGLPAATEALDPITPQYIGDLITWTAIGARTTESQTHREMASGLSTPVGFKNATDGSIETAINAVRAARESHHFLGITSEGRSAVFHTRGNRYGHLVIRGGNKPNYDAASIRKCEAALRSAGLPVTILVDCSHGNSNKDFRKQPAVLSACVKHIERGNKSIVGFMVESNISAGRQNIPEDLSSLEPLVSVTDACLDWPATERMLLAAHRRLRSIRSHSQASHVVV